MIRVCFLAIATVLAVTANAAEPAKKVDGAITTELADWKRTQEIIAKHKGKVVVLDLWSSWCEPCVKEFPGLKQYFADMKASGKSSLSQAKLKTSDFGPWIATLAFVTPREHHLERAALHGEGILRGNGATVIKLSRVPQQRR